MRLLTCLLLRNQSYIKYHNITYQPEGIVVHSTDKAGRVIKRFVQPYPGQTEGLYDGSAAVTENRMLEILGTNLNGNDWNRAKTYDSSGQLVDLQKSVHAVLGKVADGSYAVCKTLEFTQPCWGCGSGKNGSYNGCYSGSAKKPLYVQFEQVEDSVGDQEHCRALYDLSVEFCVYLCRLFPSIKVENIVSHKEAAARGYASGHGDPENYWQRCGVDFTMNAFRAAVKAKLEAEQATPSDGLFGFPDVQEDDWYADALRWAVEHKVILQSGKPFNPNTPLDKATFVVLLRRAYTALLTELNGG